MILGIAELVILMALGIAALIFIGMARAAKSAGMRPKSRPAVVDYGALNDDELQTEIVHGRTINAIKRYHDLTGAGLKEAKDAVEWAMAEGLENFEPKKRSAAESFSGAGIRDLLKAGRRDEAVELYAKFAGVDEYTAQDAVADIERAMRLEDDTAPDPELSPVLELLRAGNKIAAIKAYRDLTGAGLAEAKDAVETLERDS